MHFSPELIRQFFDVLFVLLCAAGMLQLLYLSVIHAGCLRKQRETLSTKPPVSIIVCARNEFDNLYKNLPLLLAQNYPLFEVILVNHQSIDDSKYMLYAFKQEYPHLHIIEISRNEHLGFGKKLPLSLGIKGAKYDHVLLTDADCEPGPNWLQSMAGQFTSKNEIVLGYSPVKPEKGWMNLWCRFDTAWIGMNYLGAARNGFGYMAVGRNLGYKKELFYAVNGFKKHYSIASGDDDLFFQTIAKSNYSPHFEEDSFVYTEGKKSWSDWVTQKRRHLSTAPHYKVFKKAMLGIYPLTLFLMGLSFLTLLWDDKWRWFSLAVFAFVVLVKWAVQSWVFSKLKESRLAPLIPVLEWVYFMVLPIIYVGRKNQYDGRWK